MMRPNILVLMVDQLNGTLFPDGPADWLHVPALEGLAERSRRFTGAKPVSRFSRTVSSGKISRPCGTKPMPARARS